jgi:uncharacterized protein (TIGR02594 family)
MTEPKWLAVARAQLGVREAAGPASNPKIMGWAKAVGRALGITYSDDSVPWCGLFAGYCVTQASYVPPPVAVRASAWSEWGEACSPMLGCILVFKRQGGGHVGFYLGEDKTAYHVLGGNQSDAVTVARIAKDRCVAVRWPRGYPKTKPVLMDATGKLSENEA